MDLDADLIARPARTVRRGDHRDAAGRRPWVPLAIGTWGGLDFEGIYPYGDLRPDRFFSLAAHDRWREMLARHGDVEIFETYSRDHDDGWEYQFAVVRAQA